MLPKEIKQRLFERVFICMKCGARIKADPAKVAAGKVKCRRCKSRELRRKKLPKGL